MVLSSMINKIIKTVTTGMIKVKEKGFFRKLLDKNDPEVATSNFFIICLLGIGLILLAVPVFILIVEAWNNHTITTDLNGMAAYIMAVAAIFTSAGITKIGIHYTDNKFSETEQNLTTPPQETIITESGDEDIELEETQEEITFGSRRKSKGD